MSAWCEFKIQRMYCADVESVSVAELPRVVLELQSLSRWHGVQIFPDAEPAPDGHWQFPRVSIGWHSAGPGYVFQCFETVHSNSCLLASASELSEPETYVELGGQGQELWPKQLFVPYGSVMQALNHFLTTGLQDPLLDWIGLGDFQRRATTARPRPR